MGLKIISPLLNSRLFAIKSFMSSILNGFYRGNRSYSQLPELILFRGDFVFSVALFLESWAQFFLVVNLHLKTLSSSLHILSHFFSLSLFKFQCSFSQPSLIFHVFIYFATFHPLNDEHLLLYNLRFHSPWVCYIEWTLFHLKNHLKGASRHHSFLKLLILSIIQNNILLKMGKSFRKNRQTQGQNENGQEYDPEIQNFDTLKINQGINDPQYNSILKNSHRPKKKSNSYFQNASQYQGTNIQPESEQQNDVDQQEILNDGIKMAVTQIKNERKKRSKLLEEDFQAINQEDQAHLIEMKKQNDMEGNPEHLKNQLIYFSKSIEIRQYSQQNLQQLKKFPSKNQPVCRSLAQKTKKLEKNIISNTQSLIRNYWKVARQLFDFESEDTMTENIIDDLLNSTQRSQYKTDVCNLYEQFQNESKFIDKEVEDELIRLSQKTALLKNSNKSQYNSLIMQTPIGQTKKIMKDWKRVSNRSQQKRAVFKTLFEPQQNIRQNTNPQIFDDFQFYQQISKVYEKEMCEDQNEFRVSDTMKHLKQRELRLENRIKKDVDRKASKNRKIRYNIHTKLLNFMPCKMDQTIQARDDIVKNLFNSAIGTNDEEIDYIDI